MLKSTGLPLVDSDWLQPETAMAANRLTVIVDIFIGKGRMFVAVVRALLVQCCAEFAVGIKMRGVKGNGCDAELRKRRLIDR